MEREEGDLGRKAYCAGGVVHGGGGSNQLEPGDPGVLSAASRGWKPKKVVLVACMRKLVVILNAIVRDRSPWQYSPAST